MSDLKQMLNISKIASSNKTDSMITQNNISGQGTQTDVSTHTTNYPGAQIQFTTMSALFHGSDICRKIASKLPEDALKKGVLVETEDKELASMLLMQLDDLGAIDQFLIAAIYARNFGGCNLVLNIDDGRDPEDPVNWKNIKKIYSIDPVDRRWCFPITFFDDPTDKRYGTPETYQVQPFNGYKIDSAIIHADRIIRFDGLLTTPDEMAKRNWWNICIYDLILPIINDFNAAYNLSINQMNKSTQGVFKVKNLMEALSSNTKDIVQSRWDIVESFRSVYRSIVLDADNEDFEYRDSNLNGWKDMLDSYKSRLATAADMPEIVLFGQSPSGLAATGESDLRIWYSNVSNYQQQYLKPKFEYLIKILLLAQDIDEPEVWKVVFPTVYELTPSEQIEKIKKYAEIDKLNIDAGIFTADEVALFRSQPGGYDMPMTLTNMGKVQRENNINKKFAQEVLTQQIISKSETEKVKEEVVTTDEEVVLNKENQGLQFIRQLAQKMTEMGVEKCQHNRANNCPNCGISKSREPFIDEDGSTKWKIMWHATEDLNKPIESKDV